MDVIDFTADEPDELGREAQAHESGPVPESSKGVHNGQQRQPEVFLLSDASEEEEKEEEERNAQHSQVTLSCGCSQSLTQLNYSEQCSVQMEMERRALRFGVTACLLFRFECSSCGSLLSHMDSTNLMRGGGGAAQQADELYKG